MKKSIAIRVIGAMTFVAMIVLALPTAGVARVSKGDLIVFASFGSGFTWASAAIKW